MVVRLNYVAALLATFLVVAIVRITPFTPRTIFDPADIGTATGTVKQVLFVGFFLVIGICAAKNLRFSEVVVPWPFLILIGYAVLSLSWSAAAPLAARRLAATALTAATILMAALQLRPRATLDVTRWTLVLLAAATILAGIVYPASAIHQPGDPESSVVGSWRGIFYHKNLAGGAIGLGVVLSAEAGLRKPALGSVAAFVLCAAALVLTKSKTAQLGALLAILVLLAFKGAQRLAGHNATQAALLRISVVVGGLTVALLTWFASGIQNLVMDPEAFTGRTQLWALIVKLIQQRPLLGYGYESVFQAGDDSAMAQLSTLRWIRYVPHSHNGLLDLLVTVGASGVLLYGWAMLVDPWRRVARLPEELRTSWQPVFAAAMFYALVLSLMEGKSFSAEGMQWITLVVMLGISLRLTAIIRQDRASSGPVAHAAT